MKLDTVSVSESNFNLVLPKISCVHIHAYFKAFCVLSRLLLYILSEGDCGYSWNIIMLKYYKAADDI